MLIRNIKPSDHEQLFALFQQSSIGRKDLPKKPKNGFYEYHLPYEGFQRRLTQPDISFLLENDRRPIAFMISYTIGQISSTPITDPIHQRIQHTNPKAVYADMLCVRPGLPIYVAARLFDVWNYAMRHESVPFVISAIPQHPWKNISSTRFVLDNGFSPAGNVAEEHMRLGLFVKPYLTPNAEFDPSTIKL